MRSGVPERIEKADAPSPSVRLWSVVDSIEHSDTDVPQLHLPARRPRGVIPRRLLDGLDHPLPVIFELDGGTRKRKRGGKTWHVATIHADEDVGAFHREEPGCRSKSRGARRLPE